ncbi:MAG TPA: universal stress protein [Bacteroidales bacterium]|nr:universal stress protein [Bacteroidales bacterium]
MYGAGLNPPVVRKIMVAVDGSPASIKGIEHAVQLAKEKNAELIAIYVDTTADDMDSRGYFSYALIKDIKDEKELKEIKSIESSEIAEILGRHYEQAVKPVTMIHGEAGLEVAEYLSKKYNIKLETIIERGHEAQVIVGIAKKLGIDMIVIGSHGLKGLDKFLLGSVADKVSKLAHCPVLIVKP